MSSSNDGCGGCSLLFIVIFPFLLVVTKPDEAAHRQAIAEKTPISSKVFNVMEVIGDAKMVYHDYFFFSVMSAKFDKTNRELPLSYGYLGTVHYGKEKD